MATDGRFEGRVVAIWGAVIDLAFDYKLPSIEDAVEIVDSDGRAVVAEIQAHLDSGRARAIALEPTTGLGAVTARAPPEVRSPSRSGRRRSGAFWTCSAGSATAARPCRPTPRAGPFTASPRRSRRRPARRTLRHWHQGDRSPSAARPGREGRDVRRRGRRQDRSRDGAHPRDGRELSGHFSVRGCRRAVARRPRDAARHEAIGGSRTDRPRLRTDGEPPGARWRVR